MAAYKAFYSYQFIFIYLLVGGARHLLLKTSAMSALLVLMIVFVTANAKFHEVVVREGFKNLLTPSPFF